MVEQIILNSTGAMGDMIIATALQKRIHDDGKQVGIISNKFFKNLWDFLPGGQAYLAEEVPEDAQVFSIAKYLRHMPHSSSLPQDSGTGHLAKWMAVEYASNGGKGYAVSRDDVRICLTEEEVMAGRDHIYALSGGKPVVAFAPFSQTKNRNMSTAMLEDIVGSIRDVAFPLQILGPGEQPLPCFHHTVEDGFAPNLRDAASRLYAVDAYVGVDSGPLHLVNGAIQGTALHLDGTHPVKTKIIAVVGSSLGEVVSYNGNRVVSSTGGCAIAPCGAHGYHPVEEYSKAFALPMFPSGKEKDMSGCITEDYARLETAPCMLTINPDEVIAQIKSVLD